MEAVLEIKCCIEQAELWYAHGLPNKNAKSKANWPIKQKYKKYRLKHAFRLDKEML